MVISKQKTAVTLHLMQTMAVITNGASLKREIAGLSLKYDPKEPHPYETCTTGKYSMPKQNWDYQLNHMHPGPKFWLRLSVVAGNLIQLVGLAIGGATMYAAAHLIAMPLIRPSLMLIGWFVIYLCCHAIAHWAVGRLVGIRFQNYGLRGTDQPSSYPPGIRQIMSILPLLTIVTRRDCMATASRMAKVFMFASGELSSTAISIVAAWYAWRTDIPGGGILLLAVVIWSIAALVASIATPRGDFAKARNALRK